MNRFTLILWSCCWLAPFSMMSQITGGDGKLLRIDTYQDYTALDSAAFQRVLYEYPIPTQRIETSYQFEEGLWVAQTRFNYTFDALGRTIENIFERYDAGSKLFSPQTRIQNFHRGSSITQLDSVLTYNWSENLQDWELSITQRNRFNLQNQLIESETVINFLGQSFRNRDLKFYDANGNNTRIENYSFVNNQYFLTGFTNQVFTNGQLTTSIGYAAISPTDSIPLSRTLLTYTNNKLSSSEGSTWDLTTKAWKKNNSTIYTYNEEQQLQTQISTLIVSEVEQKNRTDFFYTANGNLARTQNYQGSGTPTEWALDSKRFYYYDLASSLREPSLSPKLFKISPNPSADEVRLELPFGASFQVFNAGGQLQASGIMNGQKVVDIRSWPSGMYWVLARQGTEVLLGKIIKP